MFDAAATDIEQVSALMDAGWDVASSTGPLVDELQQAVAAANLLLVCAGPVDGAAGPRDLPASTVAALQRMTAHGEPLAQTPEHTAR